MEMRGPGGAGDGGEPGPGRGARAGAGAGGRAGGAGGPRGGGAGGGGRRRSGRRAARRTRWRPTSATKEDIYRIAGGRGGAGRARSTCWSTTRARWARRRCGRCSTPSARTSRRVLEVNLVGPFRLTRRCWARWCCAAAASSCTSPRTRGSTAYPGWGAYGVSKAALDHLGRIWAAELAGTGVRFLTVDPGRDGHRACTRRRCRRRTARRSPTRRRSRSACWSSSATPRSLRAGRASRPRPACAPAARRREGPLLARAARVRARRRLPLRA